MKKYVFFIFAVLFCLPALQAQVKGTAAVLRTQDGWEISAVYQPAEAEKPTVLLLHDVGKNKNEFTTFSGKLADNGIGYLALDLRGHGASVNLGLYEDFAKEGVDNDYNKMTRNVHAAVEFLKNKKVPEENMVLLGAGMGANVAAKAASLWPAVGGVALITPVTNFRDVLTIPALRVYKGNVFIAAAADDKKTFLEASLLRNVAFLSSGEGKVVFATAYDQSGHALLDRWITPELIQWLLTPLRPEIKPDILDLTVEQDPYGSYEPVAPSATEEALVPSVLM